MYIFETDSPTGNEILASKDFIKKMKKFIGKAKEIDESKHNNHLKVISELIENDLLDDEKLKKKFVEKAKGGQTITVDDFTKVMESFKIKGEVLETAIAHITVISEDLGHLDYQSFLDRFTN